MRRPHLRRPVHFPTTHSARRCATVSYGKAHPMEPAVPFDWHRMFVGDEPALFYLEIVFRVVVIYLYAVLLVRLMGKRGSEALSPLENMVIIALGSAVGDSMFYPEVPITCAAMIVTLIVGLSRAMAWLQTRNEAVNNFLDGVPLLIIEDGAFVEGALGKARMREDELLGRLRVEGIENTGEVKRAWLERSGALGIFRYDQAAAREIRPTAPPADGED